MRLRVSAREGIHNDVHAKACVVDGREALVVGMVVPLGAVVFIAVQNSDSISVHYRFQVLVDEVVAPTIELMTRCGRAILKLEESRIDLMIVWKIYRHRKGARDLFHRRFVKHTADVVIMIVDENHSTTVDEASRISSLRFRKTKWEMPRQIHERVIE